MPITDKFFAINIRKYLALGDDHEAGEPALIQLLSGFSCFIGKFYFRRTFE